MNATEKQQQQRKRKKMSGQRVEIFPFPSSHLSTVLTFNAIYRFYDCALSSVGQRIELKRFLRVSYD